MQRGGEGLERGDRKEGTKRGDGRGYKKKERRIKEGKKKEK